MRKGDIAGYGSGFVILFLLLPMVMVGAWDAYQLKLWNFTQFFTWLKTLIFG